MAIIKPNKRKTFLSLAAAGFAVWSGYRSARGDFSVSAFDMGVQSYNGTDWDVWVLAATNDGAHGSGSTLSTVQVVIDTGTPDTFNSQTGAIGIDLENVGNASNSKINANLNGSTTLQSGAGSASAFGSVAGGTFVGVGTGAFSTDVANHPITTQDAANSANSRGGAAGVYVNGQTANYLAAGNQQAKYLNGSVSNPDSIDPAIKNGTVHSLEVDSISMGASGNIIYQEAANGAVPFANIVVPAGTAFSFHGSLAGETGGSFSFGVAPTPPAPPPTAPMSEPVAPASPPAAPVSPPVAPVSPPPAPTSPPPPPPPVPAQISLTTQPPPSPFPPPADAAPPAPPVTAPTTPTTPSSDPTPAAPAPSPSNSAPASPPPPQSPPAPANSDPAPAPPVSAPTPAPTDSAPTTPAAPTPDNSTPTPPPATSDPAPPADAAPPADQSPPPSADPTPPTGVPVSVPISIVMPIEVADPLNPLQLITLYPIEGGSSSVGMPIFSMPWQWAVSEPYLTFSTTVTSFAMNSSLTTSSLAIASQPAIVIPEPTGLFLLLTGTAFTLGRRRRRSTPKSRSAK